MFLRHEGYLGAIGAFLKGVEEEGKTARYQNADTYSIINVWISLSVDFFA